MLPIMIFFLDCSLFIGACGFCGVTLYPTVHQREIQFTILDSHRLPTQITASNYIRVSCRMGNRHWSSYLTHNQPSS